ncbi:hypothetical protein IP81_16490, partial [Novosphingobium sp. AAP83]|uniref:FG-GAP-like repeat-containing protein n=1 Tax=Novosphingobium sp. AAP83 TaxID=1523425 RepID=UPI0006CD3EC0
KAPVFVDLDGDGRLDLVSGEGYGAFRVWQNTANGYVELTGVDNPLDGINVGIGGLSRPSFVDLDGDGQLDLVAGGLYSTTAWQSTGDIKVTILEDPGENQAPTVDSAATRSFEENGDYGAYFASATDPQDDFLTWMLGGVDAALFDINNGGVVTFKIAPNFEAPADANSDNVYDITVTASDYMYSSAAQAVAITVTDVNEAPSVTSGATANFAETGTGTVYTATGTDPENDNLTWTLGGADAALFDISNTGAVTFKTAPNFAAPADADADNVYDIIVRAFDGTLYSPVFEKLDGPADPFVDPADPSNVISFVSEFSKGADFSAPTFLDLVGDSRLDLVSGGTDGTFKVWERTDSGYVELIGAANPLNGLDAGDNSTPAFVDLDGDGRLDLVSGEYYGTFKVWQNTVNGYTELTGSDNPFDGFDAGVNFRDKSTPTFVDLDGDGRLDLVSGEYYGTFRVWQNTVNGYTELTGADNPFNLIDYTSGYFKAPVFVDLDGDGRLDLVSGEQYGTIRVWQNTVNGYTELTGADNPFNLIDNTSGFAKAPVFVDLDGDGRLDLVSG